MTDFFIHGNCRHRMATDGPGINTLVAIAGCPASCRYCINKAVLKRTDARRVSPEALLAEVMNDACYMLVTGGGVTFGGGEPLLQHEAILAFARIRPAWMKINIETSLQAELIRVDSLIPFVDQWIVDAKAQDPKVYERYTGLTQDKLVRNLALLKDSVPDRLTVRVPSIPDYVSVQEADAFAEQLEKEGFLKLDRFAYIIKDAPEMNS